MVSRLLYIVNQCTGMQKFSPFISAFSVLFRFITVDLDCSVDKICRTCTAILINILSKFSPSGIHLSEPPQDPGSAGSESFMLPASLKSSINYYAA